MKIIATSIFVENQDAAKQFYTEKLGFELVNDMDVGGGYRWLTVKEANSSNPVEVVLEPNASPIAKNYQEGLFNAGIPVTMFGVDDIEAVQRDLKDKDVQFHTEVKEVDQIKMAIFNDTCGNLIQIIEQ
ncbi:VOC family protein [Staphylococcus gallinarum]|uniref:Lactoylglutathione lyase n=1 Tax=Staphylococcus gallinarum TaxID=1293 RepID=A0A0D0SEQ2_STAGA|nr:VOC family protein [Staphylococcus gallinarum]KIR10710.1 glyoxalase [Staphylococcus gallinarum]MBU7218603.1 VOC family protein [Staphylococcus gallinarum]MCD8794338.1 VOC family protein [Staphylococcus gallinarum]MCD8821152.1 VOC family protein [Staphylococcus gallinarum]MCD8825260.1 VOC family protein [Staphylococcus gallinarum]